MKFHIIALAAVMTLGACAGRDARPVSTVRATDEQMSCNLMLAEYNSNFKKAVVLAGEKDATTGKNVALGVVGVVLFWPALFAMDLKGAEGIEMRALRDRNEHLRSLMVQKRCRNIPKPVPIKRETKNDPKFNVHDS